MIFNNTIWLWGSLALLLPLFIHLWNRKKTAIMPFGSIRFLYESASVKSKNIQFNEFWLFLLRILLITCIVFFLAGLTFRQQAHKEHWLIYGDGIEIPEGFRSDNYLIHPLSSLTEDNKIKDAWAFLNEIGASYSEIDSILWIDDFNELNLIGAIPSLPFYLNFIDVGKVGNKEKEVRDADTIHYKLERISSIDSLLIERILKTITDYSNSTIVFNRSSEMAEIFFLKGTKEQAKSELNFIFTDALQIEEDVHYLSHKKLVYLSSQYLKDQRKHQELLLIIAEYCTQYVQTSFDFEVNNSTKSLLVANKENISSLSEWKYSDELLMALIILLLIIERYMVYFKKKSIE